MLILYKKHKRIRTTIGEIAYLHIFVLILLNMVVMNEDNVLKKFSSISLEDMEEVNLMNRIDTKYVFKRDILNSLLHQIVSNYFVLTINEKRSFPYISLYYDTAKDYMYLAHHNGKLNRYKIRFRKYIDSNNTFLEVKKKVKGVQTYKKRIEVEDIEPELTTGSKEFIEENTLFNSDQLKPTIYTNFDRITLVNKNFSERVTIDRNLHFINNPENSTMLGNTVIIEVKRSIEAKRTFLIDALTKLHIHPCGMSKYCIGRALLEPDLKTNNFKEKIRNLNKLENDNSNHGIDSKRVS